MEDDYYAEQRMEAAKNLSPENHQPWEEDLSKERTLRDALFCFVAPAHRTMVSRFLAADAVGLNGFEARARMFAWLWHLLRARIQSGEIIARGQIQGSQEFEQIKPEFFGNVEPDFDRDTLSSNGFVYAQVRILSPASVPREAEQIYRTGVAGRPSSLHLILAELRARHDRGERLKNLAPEVRALLAWLAREHKDAPPLGQDAAENGIRDEFNALKRTLK